MDYSPDEILEIFEELATGDSNYPIITQPPYDVRNGETYIYQLQRIKDTDFLRDGLNGFRQQGANKAFGKDGLIKRYYYMKVEGVLVAKKLVFSLSQKDGQNGSFVILQYIGEDKYMIGKPHGNSKKGKIFASSVKAVGQRLQERSRMIPQPTKIYEQDVKESRAKHGHLFEQHAPVNCARNRKQVEYYKSKELQSLRMNKDEIIGILDMARCPSGKFILDVHMHPNVHVIVAEPFLMKYAKAILQESARNKQLKGLISFDTTFSLSKKITK